MRIGIDLGGSHIGVGIISDGKIIVSKDKNFTNEDRKNIEKSILEFIDQLIQELMIKEKLNLKDIELIGIAAPGTISNGIISKAENLNLKNFDIVSELRRKYNIPVIIRNDAKAAALAEKKYGSMKEFKDCLFLTIGTGIGGAAFINGKLIEPRINSGLEFGHMVIEKNGIECNCGKKGCFEKYASIKALKMKVTKDLNVDGDISGQYLRENLLIIEDEKVQKDVEDFLEYLKIGIGNLIDIFEPEIICLGGSFSHYEGNPIFDRLVKKINSYNSTFNHYMEHKIVLAKLKNEAGIIGATIVE